MPGRPTWKGFLRLSLVTVPVKGYTATAPGGGEIHLNQLHSTCRSRIRYQKTCPIHGEVPKEEIVSGYEYAKGQYVIIDPDDLDKLWTESDKSIQISSFVAPDAIDPIYYSGQTYYLAPDGPIGNKPYVLLHDGMSRLRLHAIAQVVLRGKEQLVLLRPVGRVIAMDMLAYASQVVQPAAVESEIPDEHGSPEEAKLVETLLNAQRSEHFKIEDFKDVYTEKLSKLIEAKVAGKEIVAPPEEPVQVINLMDALKQSLAAVSGAKPSEAEAEQKPPKKMAKSVGKKGEARKRKSS